jgi:uncharacterized Zn finger protein (UPF0148 family)
MKGYEPSNQLCPVCRATLLASVTADGELVCPTCEDWQRKAARVE